MDPAGRFWQAWSLRVLGLFLSFLLVASGCATQQGRYVSLDGQPYAPLPEEHEVEIFRTGKPDRSFTRISTLDVHIEKTHFLGSEFEDALPELKRQARLSGAAAVVDIEERRSTLLETRVFHLRGVGIRYTSP